jgi:hypothetical protein
MPWSGSAPNQSFSRTDGTRTGDDVWQQAEAALVNIVSDDHDTHDEDIASGVNACLKKDGGNKMSGQFLATSGSAGAPGIAFGDDTDTGIFRPSADRLDISTGGTARAAFQSSGMTLTVRALVPDGSFTQPSIAFSSDLNTGLYRVGDDSFGLVAGNGLRFTVATTALTATVPVLVGNGTAGAPTIGFSSDTDTGLFRVGADSIGISAGGTSRVSVSTTATTSTVPVVVPGGSAGAPSLTFSGDTDTGIYRFAADTLSISTGGTVRASFSTSALGVAYPVRVSDGSAGTPSLSFNDDTNTGFYRFSSDVLSVTTGGTLRASFTTTSFASAVPIRAPDGAVGTPSISFNTDTDTGIYLFGSNQIGFATAGTDRVAITTTDLVATVFFVGPVGAAATPTYTFTGDVNTGMYRPGADQVALSAGGVAQLSVSTTAVTLTNDLLIGASSVINPASGSVTGMTMDESLGSMVLSGIGGTGVSPLSIRTTSAPAPPDPNSEVNSVRFYWGNDQVGSIRVDDGLTIYNTTSDRRLKGDLAPFDSGAILDRLDVGSFFWKSSGARGYGVIAQDAIQVFPLAVSKGSPDDVDPDSPDFVPYAVDYSKFVPVLLAEVKSLRARVAALEA